MTARKQIVEGVAERVGDFLTVTQTRKVSGILDEQLHGYDITELRGEMSQTDKELVQMFLDAKRIEGKSERTVKRYDYIIGRALDSIGVPVEKISVYHVRQYLIEEKGRGVQDSTLEGIRSVLSSFFGWTWKEGLISSNPCANVTAIKCQKKIRMPYTAVDVEKLKAKCETKRDRALICFLLATGARVSEVCALNRSDVDMAGLRCKVLGKGNKERTVYLDTVTAMEVQTYLDSRTDESPALFAGRGTERLTNEGIRFMLNKLGKLAGVDNVHPHRFRRTLATNLINRGMPIQEVAEILGHENINTTMKYVFVSQRNVQSSYSKYCA